MNTTDSMESNNKKSNEKNININYIHNNQNGNVGSEKKDYIIINESTEISPLNKVEDKNRKFFLNINTNERIQNKEILINPNSMGINTTKLHKTIENDLNKYDNMSKIIKDQIGNYNSKLNQISKNFGNLNSSIEKQKAPSGELNRKDFNSVNAFQNNPNYNKNIKDNTIENKNDGNKHENFSDRNNKNKKDLKDKSLLSSLENKNNLINMNLIEDKVAYDNFNYGKNNNYSNNNKFLKENKNNNLENKGLNYNYNKLMINTLGNSDSIKNENQNHKIDDLEKNINYLKNRIENNLKSRDYMIEKFKEENINIFDKDKNNLLSNNNYLSKDYRVNRINTEAKKELDSVNNSIEYNLNNLEIEQFYQMNTTHQMDNDENSFKNNIISGYLEKYKENISKEKSKNEPKNIYTNDYPSKMNKEYYIKQENLQNNNNLIENERFEDTPEFQKKERKKVLEMIKDCKKEIEIYKQKITNENQDGSFIPNFNNKNTNNINKRTESKKIESNKDTSKNNIIKIPEAHHKTNFTLGRQQDFNNTNNNDENMTKNSVFDDVNSTENKRKRTNKSSDRYFDSKLNDISINETYLTNIKKIPNNDYSSNINLTLESVLNKSPLGNKYLNNSKSNKIAEINKSKNRSNNKSTNKSAVSKSKNNSTIKPDNTRLKTLNSINNSKNIKSSRDSNEPINSNISKRKKFVTIDKNKDTTLISKKTNLFTNTKNDINKSKNSKINNSYINTTLSTIKHNKGKVINLDKISNIDNLSSLDENLEQVRKQKREILQQENEILKEKIFQLELKIDNLSKANGNLFNNEEDPSKNNLIMELQIWKSRSEKITENYIHTLNDLRNQLKHDKKHYVDLIKNMQNNFQEGVDRLKKVYDGNIIRNEKTIKKLKKENEDISKKLTKVKDIIAINQNNNFNKK